MIKVLHKALALLELVGKSPEVPQSLSELAAAAGLNQPTTARILSDLVERGYVEQISRSKGYILGPMAYQLPMYGEYRSGLLKIARPMIRECAQGLKQSVMLATARNGRRYIHFHENHNPHLNIEIDSYYYCDFYFTATGRILLAHMPEKELAMVLERDGLPQNSALWHGISTTNEFHDELERVRQDRAFIGDNTPCSMTVMAFPVFQNRAFVAALGASMPVFCDKQEKEYVHKQVKRTAEAITLSLSAVKHFG